VSDDTTRVDEVRYDDAAPGGVDPVDLWARHLQEIGLYNVVSLNPADPDYLKPNHFYRLEYWRLAGLSPLLPDPRAPYTPYGVPEEIELRMFHGNNYPWIYSRLEHTTQAMSNAGYGFLRASPGRAGRLPPPADGLQRGPQRPHAALVVADPVPAPIRHRRRRHDG
jgi:hypothetical protein